MTSCASLDSMCGPRVERINWGVWQDNAYPGTTVDSQFPFYQFDDEGLLKDWQWREEFFSRNEVLLYMDVE